MKSLLFALTCIFIVLATSCRKDPVKDATLEGAWIESSSRQDTLEFREEGFMVLKSELELRNGLMQPKRGSGPYHYLLKKDSIQLQSLLSSMYDPKAYRLEISGNRLYIQDFYQKTGSSATMLTFIRLN